MEKKNRISTETKKTQHHSLTSLQSMHRMEDLLGHHNIISCMSSRDKATLIWRYKIPHMILKPISNNLGNDLIDDITKANGTKLLKIDGPP